MRLHPRAQPLKNLRWIGRGEKRKKKEITPCLLPAEFVKCLPNSRREREEREREREREREKEREARRQFSREAEKTSSSLSLSHTHTFLSLSRSPHLSYFTFSCSLTCACRTPIFSSRLFKQQAVGAEATTCPPISKIGSDIMTRNCSRFTLLFFLLSSWAF